MILYALAQFIDRLTERKEVRVHLDGNTVSVGLASASAAGLVGAEVVSFPKPEFFRDDCEHGAAELWLELSAHEQKLALGLTRALMDNRAQARWN